MAEEGFIDTHVHTHYCDGALPSEVVNEARKQKLVAVYITDHQEIDGIDDVARTAEEAGTGLEVLPGIEVSTMEGIDLLGFLIDHHHPLIREECNRIQAGRKIRGRKMAEKLQSFFDAYKIPIRVPFDNIVDALTINGNIAGGHFEKFIYDQVKGMYEHDPKLYQKTMHALVGAINKVNDEHLNFDDGMDITEKFAVRFVKEVLVRKQLLVRKKPCHVPRSLDDCWTIDQAVAMYREAKGVVVAAHPGGTNRDDILVPILEKIDGLEVLSSKHTPEQNADYGKMVIEHHRKTGHSLVITAGSDWHGPEYSPHLTIGFPGVLGTGGNVESHRPTYEIIKRLRARKESLYD